MSISDFDIDNLCKFVENDSIELSDLQKFTKTNKRW